MRRLLGYLLLLFAGSLGLSVPATAGDLGEFDLHELPRYKPEQQVAGTIRNFGFGLGGVLQLWEEAFRKIHPGIRFDDKLPTSDAAIPALVTGVTDLGPDGGEPAITEALSFFEVYGYPPLDITVASGAFDVEGKSNGPVIFVHKDNPITQVSMEQLDGIFGAERDGGWNGLTWDTSLARGPEKNIRNWGQLGLTGEWADKPIHVYGYNLRYHIPTTFERLVFQGGAKWNEQLVEFTNYKNSDGSTELEAKQVVDAVAQDPLGIGYSSIAFLTPGTKALAIAARGSDKYVELNLQTLRSREYPLADEVYFYVRRDPGRPLDPKVKEYLRYVLSREGQDAVQKDGKYLPLPARIVAEQLKRLE